jgi:hypothetical protein
MAAIGLEKQGVSRAIHEVASRHVSPKRADDALAAVGLRGDEPHAANSREERAQLVARYVRALREVGVEASAVLERELFTALDAVPQGECAFPIRDALSLVALRNHVRVACVCAGMDWARGMQLQSAVSEVAREVASWGVATLAIAVRANAVQFAVGLPPGSAGRAANAVQDRASWVAGLLEQSQSYRILPHPSRPRLEFDVAA